MVKPKHVFSNVLFEMADLAEVSAPAHVGEATLELRTNAIIKHPMRTIYMRSSS
jgi:hypothetical protein